MTPLVYPHDCDDRDLCVEMRCPMIWRDDDCLSGVECPRVAAFMRQIGAVFMLDDHDDERFVANLPGVKQRE
jgi:hypothetical protein